MFEVRSEIDRMHYLIEAKADRLAEAKSIYRPERVLINIGTEERS